MKKIYLGLGLAILSLCAACGSNGGPNRIGQGNFSNSSLNGQYSYRVSGSFIDSSNNTLVPYTQAGTFNADGKGTITAGMDDSVVSGGTVLGAATTGNYSISNDGTGTVTLNGTSVGGGSSITFAVTLVSSAKLYMIEEDLANTYGVAELQNAPGSAFPVGTYTFRMHDALTDSRVGVMTVAGDGTITGTQDLLLVNSLDNGTATPLPLVGSLSAPASGRGSGSFSDGTTFEYYVIDSNNLRFLRTDSGVNGLGRAEAQTGTFMNASLTGGFAFGSRADDSTNIINGVDGVNAQNTVGQIVFDGNGGVSGGQFDLVKDGTAYLQTPIVGGGNYSVDSTGRAVVNFTSSTLGPVQQIFWLVSPSRAFFLTNDTTKYEDGIADQQQITTFSNASLSGQYAFVMDGSDNVAGSEFVDRVGWINADGNGNLSLEEVLNNSSNGGFLKSNPTGTYTFSDATSGRASSNVLGNGTNDLVFYVVSNSKAYLLQNDAGVEIIGQMELQ